MPDILTAETSPKTGKPKLLKAAPYDQPVGGFNLGAAVRKANRWRESYNPLRGLVMSRVADLLEQGERGEFADLQWLFRFVEKRDPILRAIIRRRRAALQKLDWEIQAVSELPDGATEAQAEAQVNTLREAYEFVDNLREAIAFLATAEFRGFAHVQKHYADGAVRHLECLPQWNWVRDGMYGQWLYNEGGQNVGSIYLLNNEAAQIDPRDFIIREEEAPIDEIASVIFVRKNLSQKDWDAFVEIFGIPGCVVIGPPTVPKQKEAEYRDAAEDVAEGGNGYLPNGSNVSWPSDVRGTNPFKEHKDDLDTQLVIAGTGGKLTMLNEATGLGSGNADSHQSSFDDLAIEEASVISELFQRYFDAEVLERAHPGEPMLAYFKLKADDKQDLKAFSDTYGVAVRAGLVTPNLADEAQFREMTSLPPVSPEVKASWAKNPTREPITIQQIGQPQPGQFGRPSGASGDDTEPEPIEDEGDDSEGDEDETAMVNRAGKEMVRLVEAFSDDLAPIRQRLERILAIEDESILRAKLEEFRGELPQLLKDINADPRAARVMEDFMQAAFQQGVKS